MNPTTVQMDQKQKEEEILSFEVSDEALESAAATEMATPYTFAPCTGLLVCPGRPAHSLRHGARGNRRQAAG